MPWERVAASTKVATNASHDAKLTPQIIKPHIIRVTFTLITNMVKLPLTGAEDLNIKLMKILNAINLTLKLLT
jgi:hypothetical protein